MSSPVSWSKLQTSVTMKSSLCLSSGLLQAGSPRRDSRRGCILHRPPASDSSSVTAVEGEVRRQRWSGWAGTATIWCHTLWAWSVFFSQGDTSPVLERCSVSRDSHLHFPQCSHLQPSAPQMLGLQEHTWPLSAEVFHPVPAGGPWATSAPPGSPLEQVWQWPRTSSIVGGSYLWPTRNMPSRPNNSGSEGHSSEPSSLGVQPQLLALRVLRWGQTPVHGVPHTAEDTHEALGAVPRTALTWLEVEESSPHLSSMYVFDRENGLPSTLTIAPKKSSIKPTTPLSPAWPGKGHENDSGPPPPHVLPGWASTSLWSVEVVVTFHWGPQLKLIPDEFHFNILVR